jgi:hypothetical protein
MMMAKTRMARRWLCRSKEKGGIMAGCKQKGQYKGRAFTGKVFTGKAFTGKAFTGKAYYERLEAGRSTATSTIFNNQQAQESSASYLQHAERFLW